MIEHFEIFQGCMKVCTKFQASWVLEANLEVFTDKFVKGKKSLFHRRKPSQNLFVSFQVTIVWQSIKETFFLLNFIIKIPPEVVIHIAVMTLVSWCPKK